MRLRKVIVNFDVEGAARGAVTRFCGANGISRSVFYKIRAQAAGLAPGEVPVAGSRAPKTTPSRVEGAMGELALALRVELKGKGLDGGPLSVRARLIRAGYRDVPSRATLARLFTRHGMVDPEPAKRPRSSYKTFRWPRANDMWQLDGTEWRLDDAVHTKQCIYQVEDDHSRMILSWALDATENGATAINVVTDAIRTWGAPVRFLTDNGVAFNQSRRRNGSTAPLERFLSSIGVKPISGQIKKPTTQGKNERLHLTLQKFLEAHRPIPTPERLSELLAEFAEEYNNNRPHQQLRDGIETPAEAYTTAVKAPAPTPPPPAQPDPVTQADLEEEPPPVPRRNRPRGAYELGDLTMVDRQVGKDGRVSVSHCSIYVGRKRAGQILHISLAAEHMEFFSPDGESLGILARPAPSTTRPKLNLSADGMYY
jgi:transposase InsO family protein